jgi:hypothetical protein
VAIHPTQRQSNIQASIEAYVQGALVTLGGIAVAFPGVPFSAATLTRWCSLHILSTTPSWIFRRVNSDGDAGADTLMLVQFSCFARLAAPTTGLPQSTRLLSDLEDAVAAAFAIKQCIPIYDYKSTTTPTPVVGQLQVMRVEHTDLNVGTVITGEQGARSDIGVRGSAVSITLRWFRVHGR